MIRCIILFLMVTQLAVSTGCGATVVYVVRHAEKAVDPDVPGDPRLCAAGDARAEALIETLTTVENIAAVYSTNTQRTRATVKPLADARGLEVQGYTSSELDNLADIIETEHQGKAVIIAGHSNTVHTIISAFGAEVPEEFEGGTDCNDYDNLFVVVIKNDKATAVALHYGAVSPPDNGEPPVGTQGLPCAWCGS